MSLFVECWLMIYFFEVLVVVLKCVFDSESVLFWIGMISVFFFGVGLCLKIVWWEMGMCVLLF